MEPVSKQEFNKAMTRIDRRFEAVDKRFEAVDRRFDAVDQRFDAVEQKITDEIHGLATMITKGFEDVTKRLDVRERVDRLERKMTKVESALNVRL